MNKNELLAVDDVVLEEVKLPKPYKGSVFVKGMSGEDWDLYQDSILVEDAEGGRKVNLKQAKVKLLVACVCNKNGELLFTPEDIPALSKKSNKMLEALTKVAQKLNGIGEQNEKN